LLDVLEEKVNRLENKLNLNQPINRKKRVKLWEHYIRYIAHHTYSNHIYKSEKKWN